MIQQILRMSLGLLVGVWVARYLGPSDFGVLSYAFAMAALFGAIPRLGLDVVLVREFVRAPASTNHVLGTAFFLELVAGIVAYPLLIVTIVALRPEDRVSQTVVAIVGAAVVLHAVDVIHFWYESQLQVKYTVWAKTGASLAVVGVKIVLIQSGAPLRAFAWAFLAEAVLGAVGLAILYGVIGGNSRRWKVDLSVARRLLGAGWPLLLSGVMIYVYMRIDTIMIGEMLDDAQVGIYSVAVRISELWYFLPVIIAKSVFPSIIRVKKHSERLYLDRFQQFFDIMALMSMAIAIVVTLTSGMIIKGLFGTPYASAAPVLAIHVWACPFVFLGVATEKWFLAEDLNHLLLQRTVAGAALNVVLNLLLIPAMGITGAAVATLGSQALASHFYDGLAGQTRHIFWMKWRSLSLVGPVGRLADRRTWTADESDEVGEDTCRET